MSGDLSETKNDGGLSKEQGQERTAALGIEASRLAELLFAAGTHGLLIVLQGRDTSGKDGSIRRILSYVNVQSTHVVPFKVPTELELRHDFLWRVHPHAPAKGEIAIFNRSHYEDVIAVRVHKLAPEDVWRKRYAHIRAFEANLVDANVIILKFFLNISATEQDLRLREREEDAVKAWKLNVGDWKERDLWDATTEAYKDAIRETSTADAPWIVVPADKKWYRDLMVAEALVSALQKYEEDWQSALDRMGASKKAELAAFRATKK